MLRGEVETRKAELSALTETIASLQRQKAEVELGRYRALNTDSPCRMQRASLVVYRASSTAWIRHNCYLVGCAQKNGYIGCTDA